MAYESAKITIKAEATASAGEILAAGGKITLSIRNHLIQTIAKAQSTADAYLSEYKTQKLKIRVKTPTPLPYEEGDTIGVLITDSLPKRNMVIRKISVKMKGGLFEAEIELED